jgi:hypothetical protein
VAIALVSVRSRVIQHSQKGNIVECPQPSVCSRGVRGGGGSARKGKGKIKARSLSNLCASDFFVDT